MKHRELAMTIAPLKMTLEEYLNYQDDSETTYELEDGILIAMPPESDLNQRIASFLFAVLLQLGIPSYRLRIGAEIVVSGSRATTRIPDLMVLSEELATALEGARRSTVLLDMPPPLLVVEIVSPGQEKHDYRYKRSEYAARQIPEHWIVDPMQRRITVLEWVEGLYEEQVFEGDQAISSPVLGALPLIPSQALPARCQ
jgi:Uma2 family endonuclease